MKRWGTFWTRRATLSGESANVAGKLTGPPLRRNRCAKRSAPRRRESLERKSVFLKINGVFHPRRFQLPVVKRVMSPFDSADWLFEIKHDGFRVLTMRDGGPPVCIPEPAMTSA